MRSTEREANESTWLPRDDTISSIAIYAKYHSPPPAPIETFNFIIPCVNMRPVHSLLYYKSVLVRHQVSRKSWSNHLIIVD